MFPAAGLVVVLVRAGARTHRRCARGVWSPRVRTRGVLDDKVAAERSDGEEAQSEPHPCGETEERCGVTQHSKKSAGGISSARDVATCNASVARTRNGKLVAESASPLKHHC